MLISVPQHPFLWSYRDEYACHKRRYTRTELSRKLQASGFSEIKNYSFVSLLIPLMILSRKKKMDTQKFDPMKELRLSPVVNLLLDKVMDFERMMIRMGMSFPFGGSLLCVAQKGGNP